MSARRPVPKIHVPLFGPQSRALPEGPLRRLDNSDAAELKAEERAGKMMIDMEALPNLGDLLTRNSAEAHLVALALCRLGAYGDKD